MEYPEFEEGQEVRFGTPPFATAYVDTVDVDGDNSKMRLRLPGEAATFIIWKGIVWSVGS